MVIERYRWNTTQLTFKNVQNDVCGNAVSWDFTELGVPSDAEKVVVVTFLRLSFRILMWVNQTFHNHKLSFFLT